jgi:hypothetical protein
MPKMEENIDEDQVPLKKVQRYIPGFRGYLQKDDIRDADRMLRMQLSQKISVARKNLEGAKASIEEKGLMVDTSQIESALNSLKRMSSEIGYADSGYSWMASDSDMATLDRDSADIRTRLAFIEELFRKRMAVMNRTES